MRTSSLLLLLVLLVSVTGAETSDAAETIAFRVGKVVTMDNDDRVINNAVVIVEDGKITAIGRSRDR